MEAVKFTVEGLINSFRMPQTSIYQLTYLSPTRTQIIGMITNIMGKNEQEYYELLKKVKVGIIPLYINSIFNDAWTFKKWKSAGFGRDILQREKIYHGKYLIYLTAKKSLLEEIFNSLKKPCRIPSLGMDDELVILKNVKRTVLEADNSEIVHSVFRFDEGMEFNSKVLKLEKNIQIFPPRIVTINRDFKSSLPRKPTDFIQIVEFLGLYFETNVTKKIYHDNENGFNIEFI